jgi:hypothetical protein
MKVGNAFFALFNIWPFLCRAAPITEDFANDLGAWRWQWDGIGGGRQSEERLDRTDRVVTTKQFTIFDVNSI